MDNQSKQYLQRYLDSLSEEKRAQYTSFSADYFCADEYNANTCAELIQQSIKTATCSMKHWYESGEESMPQVGHLQVVLNWQGEPTSIIEVTEVQECLFSEVTEEFAAQEGEGDRTLAWWRKAHWNFFAKECAEIGIEPSEQMALVLERFTVVYQEALS